MAQVYTYKTYHSSEPQNIVVVVDNDTPESSYSYSHNDSDCLDWTPNDINTDTKVYLSTLGFLFLVGIIGNGSLILLFLKVGKLRKMANAFIINLAIGDIIYTTLFIPIEIYKEFYDIRPFGLFMCYFSITINYTSQDVSIFSITALSILRFRAVVLPLQRPPQRRKCLMLLGCLIIWVVSLAIAASATTQCDAYDFTDCNSRRLLRVHRLKMSSDFFRYYIPFQFVVLFLLPLVAISIMYGVMSYRLFRRKLPIGSSSGGGGVSTSRRQLAMVVLLLVITFTLCWFPHHIRLLIVEFQNVEHPVFSHNSELIFRNAQFFLTMLASVLNPLILYQVSSEFREQLVNTFCPVCARKGWLGINTTITTVRNNRRLTSNQKQCSISQHQTVTVM